ncbi:hypothetical protein [Paraburkholderia domus]|uniref:hypothetical protein n=1 Tax=Paraburkholderia domus TaxID=2793075 RepID=UPI001913AC37|nr:hypothetical protein [Paraburkholderia domus]MBK5065884.1 hypothetical protein [Burkholderia sp. R-70199]CAE6959064.1 hypothetical protein R70199_07172 [Paraburkholderia domus]
MARIIRAVDGHPGIPEGLPIVFWDRMASIEPAFSYLLSNWRRSLIARTLRKRFAPTPSICMIGSPASSGPGLTGRRSATPPSPPI